MDAHELSSGPWMSRSAARNDGPLGHPAKICFWIVCHGVISSPHNSSPRRHAVVYCFSVRGTASWCDN